MRAQRHDAVVRVRATSPHAGPRRRRQTEVLDGSKAVVEVDPRPRRRCRNHDSGRSPPETLVRSPHRPAHDRGRLGRTSTPRPRRRGRWQVAITAAPGLRARNGRALPAPPISGRPPVPGQDPGRPFAGGGKQPGQLRAEARRGDRHRGARRGAAGVVQLGSRKRRIQSSCGLHSCSPSIWSSSSLSRVFN